jgi:hypothetical protein
MTASSESEARTTRAILFISTIHILLDIPSTRDCGTVGAERRWERERQGQGQKEGIVGPGGEGGRRGNSLPD